MSADSLVIADLLLFELMGGPAPVQSDIPELINAAGQGATFRLATPGGGGTSSVGAPANWDLGMPQPTVDIVQSLLLDGERPFGYRASNRTMTLPIIIKAPDFVTLAAAQERLIQAVDAQTWTLAWTPSSNGLTQVFDCFRALPTVFGYGFTPGQHQPIATMTLSFQALPYGRSDPTGLQNVAFANPLFGGVTVPPVPVVLDNFSVVSGTYWSQSAQETVTSQYSARYTPPNGELYPWLAASYTKSGFPSTSIAGLTTMSVWLGQSFDTGNWAPWAAFVSNVTLRWTLLDALGHTLSFSKTYNKVAWANNALAPKWTLLSAPIPQGNSSFLYSSVIGYALKLTNWAGGGTTSWVRMNAWLNNVTANPPSIANPASLRGTAYNIMGATGSARTPFSTQFELQQANPVSQVLTGTGVWWPPVGVTTVKAECLGAGGAGGVITYAGVIGGGGGGGGEYACEPALTVAAGTPVPFSCGTGGQSLALEDVQIYSTSGSSASWLCPSNINEVYVECWGSGAAGAFGSGGGGGGEYAADTVNVTPGTSYPVAVGSGGLNDLWDQAHGYYTTFTGDPYRTDSAGTGITLGSRTVTDTHAGSAGSAGIYAVGRTDSSGTSTTSGSTTVGDTYAGTSGGPYNVGGRVDSSGTSTTSGSVTVHDTHAIANDQGLSITGTGIPAGARIAVVTPGTGYTISISATATGTPALTITSEIGCTITGTGIPANTVITAVSAGTGYTISNNATASNTNPVLTILSEIGYSLSGTGIPYNSLITAVNPGVGYTINNPATAASANPVLTVSKIVLAHNGAGATAGGSNGGAGGGQLYGPSPNAVHYDGGNGGTAPGYGGGGGGGSGGTAGAGGTGYSGSGSTGGPGAVAVTGGGAGGAGASSPGYPTAGSAPGGGGGGGNAPVTGGGNNNPGADGASGQVRLTWVAADGQPVNGSATWFGSPATTGGGRTDSTGTAVTSGRVIVADTHAIALDQGMPISGTGIPAGTTITAVTPGTGYKISNNATATGTPVLTVGGTVIANGGASVPLGSTTGAAGGIGSTNSVHYNGGAGFTAATVNVGGGGGASGGSASAGTAATSAAGAVAVTGGGKGGTGGNTTSGIVLPGSGPLPGGGGGGGSAAPGGSGGGGATTVTYTPPLAPFSTLIAHRPGQNAPPSLNPCVSIPNTSDLPNGTNLYLVPSLVPGQYALFGGTYTVVATAYQWYLPASPRQVTVTVSQYEYQGGPAYQTTVTRNFTPSLDITNGIVIMGEMTLPVKDIHPSNTSAYFTVSISDTYNSSGASDSFLDILFLDTQGQTVIINVPFGQAYENFWVDEPTTDRDLGYVLGSGYDRSQAISVLDSAIVSGGPFYITPGDNLYFVYSPSGNPSLGVSYLSRWYLSRLS